jgi:hypothetical protein
VADFFSTGPDGHAAEASDRMGQLHTPAPKLERKQTGKPAATLLIKSRHDTIDGLMLSSHLTVRMP